MKDTNIEAQFIRHPSTALLKDQKTCFRKAIKTGSPIGKLSLEIWADSRYYLWISGEYIGTGPSRNWPEFPEKDIYEIIPQPADELQVSILLHHFGTSTSQYIHGPESLAVAGRITDHNGRGMEFVSDESWCCTVHEGYRHPVPRINVSQGWVEVYDASVFPQDWMDPGFDDSCWQKAAEALPPRSTEGTAWSLETMKQRSIPLLQTITRRPAKIAAKQFVRCRGAGVRVDYKDAFYPEDVTTEDRLQTGYICCVLDSPADQELNLTLADRLWPETEESVCINGERISARPGEKELKVELRRGSNLFMLDVSGARQRFTADLHFKTVKAVKFLSPLPEGGTVFAALGPFETHQIGNIVCADGFTLDRENKDYIRAGKCGNAEELANFGRLLRPVDNVLIDGPKLRGIRAEITPQTNRPGSFPAEISFQTGFGSGDDEIILDMGIEVSGFLSFNVETAGAAEIDFNFFEYLAGTSPEIPGDLDLSMRYKTAGGKTFYRSLNRRGFRYLSIRTRAEKTLIITDLGVEEVLYPLEYRGSFSAGDPNLEEIWKMCRRTVELCSEDALIDSPAFEQAFWTGDAYVMALYHQYLFGDTALIKHSLLLAARSMHYSELPDCHLPAGVHLLLTAWAQLWVLASEDYWNFTADISFLEELYPWLLRAAEAFDGHLDARGLLTIDAWNMLDWAEMDTPYRGTVAHLNARLAACFRSVANISSIIGRTDEARKWELKAEQLADITNRAFWNGETGCYIDCIHTDGRRSEVISVQTNLMMMLYGCIPGSRREQVRSFILDPPEEAVLPGSPFLAHFYYDYLFSEGLGERAIEGIREQWSPMLEHGTCWETFIGFYRDRLTRSYCHAWSAAPAYLFGAWVLGLKTLEPGFKRIMLAPVPSGLKTAEGIVPMHTGKARLRWNISNGRFRMEAELPKGTEWDFTPPAGYESSSEIIVTFGDSAEKI